MAKTNYTDKVDAVTKLTSIFKIERYIYISIIAICLLILVASVIISMIKGEINTAELTSMFGSGGVVTFMTGRLIHMWDRAMNLIESKPQEAS